MKTETEIVSAGRFASVDIVSRHLTSIGSFAVAKELMLPIPHSTEKRKIVAKDALRMYQSSPINENWHVPFLAPLAYEQRMYHIPLDMFQRPHKIIVHTPNSVLLQTPGCTTGMDVLIHAHIVPKFLWLELVYQKCPDEKEEVRDEDEYYANRIYWEEMLIEESYRCEE